MTAERVTEGDVTAFDMANRCGGSYSIESGMRLLGVANGALFVEIARR